MSMNILRFFWQLQQNVNLRASMGVAVGTLNTSCP